MRLCNLRGLTMGTSWQVQCYVNARQTNEGLQAGIQAQLDEVVAQMSPWEDDADITRFNRAPANSWPLPRIVIFLFSIYVSFIK